MSPEASSGTDGAPSLQEIHTPEGRCFGCGPANDLGLRIRSLPAEGEGDELVCHWRAAPHHEAFENVLNGGIIGALLDCHMNWAASWHLMRRDGLERAPTTVTADYRIKLRRPTRRDAPLELRARAVVSDGAKVTVEGELLAAGQVTARGSGSFVAVGPDHPAARHGQSRDS